MRKIGIELTSEFAKVDQRLEINYKNLTCIQMLITLPIHLGKDNQKTIKRSEISRAIQQHANQSNLIYMLVQNA